MKKTLLITTFIASFIFSSCNKQPTASFTADKTTIEEKQTVSFTNTSSEALSYKWEFGDGSSSTDQSPSHTYNTAGNYMVSLTAYSKKEKKSDSYTQLITVKKESYRFTGTIGSSSLSYIVDGSGMYENSFNNGSSINTPPSLSTKTFGSTIGDFLGSGYPALSIEIGQLSYSGGMIAPSSSFISYITARSYSYSVGPVAGVAVTFTDASGTIWRSDKGTANQSGSSFSISEATPGTNLSGDEQIVFKANFSCKLYDDNGNSVQLSNGYMYAAFGNI